MEYDFFDNKLYELKINFKNCDGQVFDFLSNTLFNEYGKSDVNHNSLSQTNSKHIYNKNFIKYSIWNFSNGFQIKLYGNFTNYLDEIIDGRIIQKENEINLSYLSTKIKKRKEISDTNTSENNNKKIKNYF
ncbi:MAG: hypothetical protein ACWIPI_10635 [Polaribacter sp.]